VIHLLWELRQHRRCVPGSRGRRWAASGREALRCRSAPDRGFPNIGNFLIWEILSVARRLPQLHTAGGSHECGNPGTRRSTSSSWLRCDKLGKTRASRRRKLVENSGPTPHSSRRSSRASGELTLWSLPIFAAFTESRFRHSFAMRASISKRCAPTMHPLARMRLAIQPIHGSGKNDGAVIVSEQHIVTKPCCRLAPSRRQAMAK
jgi:hypothetical protein